METFVKGVGSGQSHQIHGNHMPGGCGEERANGYWVSLTVLVPRKLMVQNLSLQNILWWHTVAVVRSVSHADSLRPRGLQHARLPCPSLSPRVCSNSCPLSPSCHLTILSSVPLFSSCPQSFPASGSFPIIWLFEIGGQSIRDILLLLSKWGH